MIESRVEQWKRKLLNLTQRNPLLNTRETSKFLVLQKGEVFVQPDRPYAVVPYTPPEAGEQFAFDCKLSEKEVKARLKNLYSISRSLYEDSGVNQLFVATGFLHWNEEDGQELHRAPIILVPVCMERAKNRLGYQIVRTDEDAVVNFCLLELLRSQFKISVKDIEGGGFNDGDPNYGEVYSEFLDAIKFKKEWHITTDVALGIFAFDKIVIWKDLTDHEDVFHQHSFFAHLAERKGLYDDGVAVFPLDEAESHIKPDRLFCPLGADASQITAVLYSELGKSFVLHGPPGTGKSQTIANIIAHNMALGRRVLFVSEKKFALDVVYKRLESVGLSPFCLELHSNKSRKTSVMRQFQEALGVTKRRMPSGWEKVCADWAASVQDLSVYVRELHRPSMNGRSASICIATLSGKHKASSSALVQADVARMPKDEVGSLATEAKALGEEWKGVDRQAFEALKAVRTHSWSPAGEMRLRSKIDELIVSAESVSSFWSRVKVTVKAATICGKVSIPLLAHPSTWIPGLRDIREHLDGLRLVMSYRLRAAALCNRGCAPYVAAMERGEFTYVEAPRVFEESVCEKTLHMIVAESEALSSFSGLRQEEKIAHFRELDEKYMVLVQKRIVATISKIMPQPDKLDEEGKHQLALITRESSKKKCIMPIRKLLAETMPIATRLKPCFLMSPLSVAQYLPAKTNLFDVIVFDEASQMTVWDSVATIARGKQLICVGDPKQLPPTNFFVKGDATDDDPDIEVSAVDLESVLDECLANGLHSAYLNWHYRSRHEALIAFSNRHYYDDRLNTFPAAEMDARLGMSFQYVDGAVYDHMSHTNAGEAKALVDFLYERLQSDKSERERSWGIVTFSVAQKHLIEKMIEKRFAGVSWATDFLDDSKPDSFFVKNLENVQGDERDVIVFSIAYAPDAQGNFAMMFGPINHPGGERRLNVGITRAREQVIIFSSTHASAIHTERTNSVGVKHLKALMDYAEIGVLEGDGQRDLNVHAQGIVGDVRNFLELKGYIVEEKVGRSTVPIDLAVKDPNDMNRYALAIEFDGSMYAAQKIVRDREVLRPRVLEHLGWKSFRLWSIDWMFDRKRTQERLLAALPSIERLQIENK